METIDLGYKSPDGKDYYDIVINKSNGQYVMVKNSSCYANTVKELQLIEGNYKIIPNGSDSKPNLINIPKMYIKLFKNTCHETKD